MTRTFKPMRQLARHHSLHPLMVVLGVVMAAATAKLGHGMWAIGGMLAFYPTYLTMLVAGRRAADLLSRISVPQLIGQEPAYARVSA